jgi:hypothetical protein
MPEYEFRLRFNLADAYRIGADTQEVDLLTLPAGIQLRLRTAVAGTPIKDHPRASVRGGPYPSADEARTAAENAKQALLYWAVEQRLGIDFGDGRQRSVVTEAGLAYFREQLQSPVRNDLHGIDVYERTENLRFVAFNASGQAGKSAEVLAQTFGREFAGSRQLTEKQILASEIYSASFFDISHRSRFITLVTAVEALLDPAQRPEPVQKLVAELESATRTSAIHESTKEAVVGSLQWLKSESIGEAGRALCRRLLPDRQYEGRSSSAFFMRCYNLRSQILHRGSLEDRTIDMLSIANTAEGFVSNLLLAALLESPQRR